MKTPPPTYSVTVGNIGQVYDGTSPARGALRRVIAEIAAFDGIRPAPQGYRDARDRVPFDALGDDYRSNPEAACRKSLRITRAIRNNSRRLRIMDRLLGNHGVEFVQFKNGSHAFSYSNTGDSYVSTVILFASGAFRVSSWGDIVERAGHRYA